MVARLLTLLAVVAVGTAGVIVGMQLTADGTGAISYTSQAQGSLQAAAAHQNAQLPGQSQERTTEAAQRSQAADTEQGNTDNLAFQTNGAGPNNMTRRFQSLVETLEASGAAKTLSQENGAKIMKALVQSSNLKEQIKPDTSYATTDFEVYKATSTEQLRTYGNTLASVFLRHTPDDPQKEFHVYQKALNSREEKGYKKHLNDLRAIRERYKKMKKGMETMEVPRSVSHLHADLLNHFSTIIKHINGMRRLSQDPLKSAFFAAAHKQYSSVINQTYRELASLFSRKEVTFSPDEPGYILQKNDKI